MYFSGRKILTFVQRSEEWHIQEIHISAGFLQWEISMEQFDKALICLCLVVVKENVNKKWDALSKNDVGHLEMIIK